jgi:UPF0716 protein FxsA
MAPGARGVKPADVAPSAPCPSRLLSKSFVLTKLFLLFTVVPAIDLYLLIKIGGYIGAGPALALAVGVGLVGAWLARREGVRVLREWQAAVVRGEMPREGVTSSLLVLVGGVMLIAPGFLTDIIGLLLLIPPTRRLVANWLAAYARKQLEAHTVEMVGGVVDESLGGMSKGRPRGNVIDVDARGPE